MRGRGGKDKGGRRGGYQGLISCTALQASAPRTRACDDGDSGEEEGRGGQGKRALELGRVGKQQKSCSHTLDWEISLDPVPPCSCEIRWEWSCA
eukprot:767173-Hanusia_phi.AAC.1